MGTLCAASVPAGGYFFTDGTETAWEGAGELASKHQYTEGQGVSDSFALISHEGDRESPALAAATSVGTEVAIDATLFGIGKVAGPLVKKVDNIFRKADDVVSNASPKAGLLDDVVETPLLENKFLTSNAPEHPDYPIVATQAQEGQRYWMAVEPFQINAQTNQVMLPGKFLANSPITSIQQVETTYAVRSDWKSNIVGVQEYEIVPATRIQESIVGPQTNPNGTILPGLGSQTEVVLPTIDPASDNYIPVVDLLVPVGTVYPIK